MKTSTVAIAAGALMALATAGTAHASLIVSGSIGGAPTGALLDNLDSLTVGGASPQTTTAQGIVVSYSNPADNVVQGTMSGSYAAPFLSGGNGHGFGPGGTDQPDGADTTPYIAGQPGASVTLTLPGEEKYIGLLWGSVDAYNTLELYDGGTLVGTVTGSDVLASPDGNEGVNGTVYVNIDSTLPFNTVVLASSAPAFEVDNIAFASTPLVPEPVSLALLGVGLAGIGIIRRKRG